MNEANDSKFVKREWNIANENSESNYHATNEISYNTEIFKSNLCDCSDAYILVRGDITAVAAPATQVVLKNCAPFTKCITKVDKTTIDDAEDLVMPMYNSIEYSSNYSETTWSLWFYFKDEATNCNANIANDDDFKSFKDKVKLLGYTAAQPDPNAANGILRNAIIAVPLKYLRNFWRSLERPLINCKVELKLRWTKHCVWPVAGTDNPNGNNDDNNFFLLSNTQNYMFL